MEEKKKGSPKTAHSFNSHDKGNEFRSQYQTVSQSFTERPKTMFQIEKKTNIVRTNICTFVAMMEEKGIIQLLYKTDCLISIYCTGFYATNGDLFVSSQPLQLSLFSKGGVK